MAITKLEILKYCTTPTENNWRVLDGMLDSFQGSDNPDLSHITATAEDIALGKKSVNTQGAEIIGTNENNAKIPTIPEGTTFASAAQIDNGKAALVLVDGEWTLITGTRA